MDKFIKHIISIHNTVLLITGVIVVCFIATIIIRGRVYYLEVAVILLWSAAAVLSLILRKEALSAQEQAKEK